MRGSSSGLDPAKEIVGHVVAIAECQHLAPDVAGTVLMAQSILYMEHCEIVGAAYLNHKLLPL